MGNQKTTSEHKNTDTYDHCQKHLPGKENQFWDTSSNEDTDNHCNLSFIQVVFLYLNTCSYYEAGQYPSQD